MCSTLRSQIYAAFPNEPLGNGTSLKESVVVDDHGSEEEMLKAKKLDVTSGWREVPFEDLVSSCNGSGGCVIPPF